MNKQRLLAAAVVALTGLLLGTSIVSAKDSAPIGSLGPVPKAICGPQDHTEGGLQGFTTPEERYSGDSALGYNCNLELVGKFQGEGAKAQGGPAYAGNCGYYTTIHNPLQQHPGAVVVDATDQQHPQASAYLATTAMLDPHESLRYNERSKLLVGVQNTGFNNPLPPASAFDVYAVSTDCRYPVLQATLYVPGLLGHAGGFAPDGLTFYATHVPEVGMTVIDVSDPTQPKKLGFIDELAHDATLSDDGTRAYVSRLGHYPAIYPALVGPNGLGILDVSDYQFRRPNPQARVISNLYWQDGGGAEVINAVRYKGRPYVIVDDEAGSDAGGAAASCARGLPPYGFARIINITDEKNPQVISKLMLEVSDPANCSVVLNNPPEPGGGAAPASFSGEHCNVDRENNPRMLACGYQNAGLRVFDIRDPYQPKEIAYYKPPAVGNAFLPGSATWTAGVDRTVDRIAGRVRFYQAPAGQDEAKGNGNGNGNENHGSDLELWTVSDGNGLQILRFTDNFRARNEDLFQDDDEQ